MGDVDFTALAHLRISQHQQAEAARIEVERQRIEAEAKARAEREAAAKLEEDRRRIEAEQRAAAEAERARIRAEEQAKAQAEAQAARESLERQAKQQAQELVHIARELDAEKHQTEHAKTGERLTLGQINDFLAPISITSAGLAELGFQPVATVKAARLYNDADFQLICAAIARHVSEIAAIVHHADSVKSMSSGGGK
jgi:flagellar biosynthesis GTPase FlhF